jgi:hypothetical protein
MAGDDSVPECSSDVGDVKENGLSRAEASSGDLSVSHPDEGHYATHTLD